MEELEKLFTPSLDPFIIFSVSQGFLDYVAFFPFDSHVICPLAGQEVRHNFSHFSHGDPGFVGRLAIWI